jgi:hypothetical protein
MPYEWVQKMGLPLFIRVCRPPETAPPSLRDEDRNIVNVEKSH